MTKITREQVEQAIDLFIAIEPMGCSDAEYDRNKLSRKAEIQAANAIVRQYGEQISPQTLDAMQDEYYSFTNSSKYLRNGHVCSIARAVLDDNWNKIGPWRS